MKIIGVVTVGLLAVSMAGCSSGDAPNAKPDVAATSVGAPEPPSRDSHEFAVTVRDEVGYVWKVKGDACVDGSAYGPPFVGVSDASGSKPLGQEVWLIEAAATLVDGACEAEVTVATRPADRYTLEVGLEGHGIASGDEPEPTVVDGTDDEPQAVAIVLK